MVSPRLNLTQFDAVIFDMDGVLINSEPLWEESDLSFFQRNLHLAGYNQIYRRQFIGMPMKEEMRIIAADFRLRNDRISQIIEARKQSLLNIYRDKLELFPQTEDLLTRLFGKKKMAIASSSPLELIDFVVHRFGIKRFFSVLASGEEVARGKPFPDVFLYAARKLMVPPARCLVVEDSLYGIKAAKAAGMKVVALMHTVQDKDALSRADWVFPDTAALYKKIASLKI